MPSFTYRDLDQTTADTRAAFSSNDPKSITRRSVAGGNYVSFPADLGSSYYDHYMTIKGTRGNESFTAAMYIPGSGGETTIQYSDKHDYADIKLTYTALSAAGAAVQGWTGFNPAGAIAAAAAAGGHPINPGVQVLYRSPELRKFQFVFLMAPTTPKESEDMKKIIKNLRKLASPKLDGLTLGLTYTSPATFEINFYHKGNPNENIPKIRPAALTFVDVNYTPAGEWSTFHNGHPVSCMLTLDFLEMELLHTDLIEQGY